MKNLLINIAALTVTATLGLAYLSGVVGPSNAFFGALLIVTAYTGYQFSLRDGLPIARATRLIFVSPQSYPRLTSYLAYLVCTAFGLAIMAQAWVLHA